MNALAGPGPGLPLHASTRAQPETSTDSDLAHPWQRHSRCTLLVSVAAKPLGAQDADADVEQCLEAQCDVDPSEERSGRKERKGGAKRNSVAVEGVRGGIAVVEGVRG